MSVFSPQVASHLARTRLRLSCRENSLYTRAALVWTLSRPWSTRYSSVTAAERDVVEVNGKVYPRDEMTNVTPTIVAKVGRDLHDVPQHPLNIIKRRIVHHFHNKYTSRVSTPIFAHFDNISPVVTTEQNFDSLLVPADHVSRSRNDNYYINSSYVLRAHTSAHQRDLIRMGFDRFLVTGDVYRRDEIDASHYPVFHQMEGVRLFDRHELFSAYDNSEEPQLFETDPCLQVETTDKQAVHAIDAVKLTELHLKRTLTELVKDLFGPEIESRWMSVYFPFTHPSFEMEIKFNGEWLEVLGSGVMRQPILNSAGARDKIGWAFGLGLDRLAMLLFQIKDIRLFWSTDPRFLEQFQSVTLDPATNILFKPFSKHPSCYKDVSFWLPDKGFAENDFFELVRSIGGDLVEKVELKDQFSHPQTGRMSHMYRINYCSMDRTVTNEEINIIQERLRDSTVLQLGVELR